MIYAILKDSKVICTTSYEPCSDDLATRGEYSIPCDPSVSTGYFYDGATFSPPATVVPTTEELLTAIRAKRDALLSASDRYMLSDYPMSAGYTREQWTARVLIYRQELRDFPSVCDIHHPIFPTQPEG